MTTTLNNPPRVAFVDAKGILTRDGNNYIRQLFTRTGGNTALTNSELNAAIQSLVTGEMVMQPPTFDRFLPDIVQSSEGTCFDEITFQH